MAICKFCLGYLFGDEDCDCVGATIQRNREEGENHERFREACMVKFKKTYNNIICKREGKETEAKMARDKESSYYDVGGIETLDVIKAKLTKEQYEGYLLGNAIKYNCRMFHKSDSPKRDAQKASNYSKWLSESMED